MAELEPAERKIGVEIRSKDAKFVEVAVRDQGAGVSPEFAEKVFEKFHTTKKDGLGLGLTFSRRYVEQHGGKLWCEPGNQSVFRFTLPTASAEVEATAMTKDETFG